MIQEIEQLLFKAIRFFTLLKHVKKIPIPLTAYHYSSSVTVSFLYILNWIEIQRSTSCDCHLVDMLVDFRAREDH